MTCILPQLCRPQLCRPQKLNDRYYHHVSINKTSLSIVEKREFTLAECLGVLRNEPVTRFDVHNLRVGEELLDGRHRIVRNISRLSATNKERRAVVMEVIRFLEREIGHMIQRTADDR